MDRALPSFTRRPDWTKCNVGRRVATWVLICTCGLNGCESFLNKKKETQFEKDTRRIKSMLADVDRPRLIGEVASSAGFVIRKFESIALTSNLPGTGGGVRPSEQRELLLAEMRTKNVNNPESVIDASTSATVKLTVFTNPGDLKGEVLDVDVECSNQCFATDLRDGFVLPSRLKDMVVLENRVRTSRDYATGSGEIVILPTSYTKRGELEPLKGVIVGGGRLLEDRKLGIRVNSEYQHVFVTKSIASAINQRFFYRDGSKQQTVAEGKNDRDIVLRPMPKYRGDPDHFMTVVLTMGFGEDEAQTRERIEGCKKLLLDRNTCRRAAAELEAIGTPEATSVLMTGLMSADIEVRFHSAYALTYLDVKESVPVLTELARVQPAFRPLCLTGLSANDTPMARAALEGLLQDSEPETRFGAFLAIRSRNGFDAMVTGESIGEELCHFVHVPSATPLIVVSLQKKKEIVLFGSSIGLAVTAPIQISSTLKLASSSLDQIRITKRHLNGEVSTVEVDSDLPSLLKGLGTVNANYCDIVHTIDQLDRNSCLASPVAMNPRPHAGRIYQREQVELVKAVEPAKDKSSWWTVSSLWSKSSKPEDKPDEKKNESVSATDDIE